MSSKRQPAKKVAKNLTEIDVAKVQNLRLRGRIFYYHRDLPSDVRHLFDLKSQLWISLRTSDLIEAKRKCLELTLEHDRLINGFRSPASLVSKPPLIVNHFTEEYLHALSKAWGSEWMRDDEKRRSRGLVNDGEFHLLGMSHTPASLRKLLLLEGRNWSGIAPEIAKQWLDEQSIEMLEDSEAFLDLVSMIRLEAFECLEILESRTKGIPVKSPPIIKVDKPKARVGILDMVEPWKVVKKPAVSSIRVFVMAANRFEELHPEKSLADIERVDIVNYRDWLTTTKGLSAATVEQQMSAIKALLSIALDRDIVKVNVATKVMPPKRTLKEQDARRPFSVSQLNQLFSSPIYQGKKIPSGGKGPAAMWLPLLALFTGGRVEELCQLRLDDVLEEDGIPYLFIRNEHEEQTVKNRGSVRRVPLHQELLRLGFLQYVEKQRAIGREWVFSELIADIHGKRSGNWSKWFSRYLREVVGVLDKDVVFHSLRHNFIDCCRDCKIGEEVHDAMTGHRNGSVSRSYGSSLYPLGPLSDAINQFRVKGVTFPIKL